MNLTSDKQNRLRSQIWNICLMGIVFCSGCSAGKTQLFAPAVPRRPIEELFHEAVSQTLPEQTLSIQRVPFEAYRPTVMGEVFEPAESGKPVVPPSPHTVPQASPVPVPPPLDQSQKGAPADVDLTNSIGAAADDRPQKRRNNTQRPSQLFLVDPDQDLTNHEPLVLTDAGGVTHSSYNPKSKRTRKVVQTQHLTQTTPKLGTEKRVSEFFEETDVRQAVQSMASQVGVSVIMDDQVSGVVSIILENESFESGLAKVLMPLGFIYKRHDDGTYLVGVSDPTSPLFPLISEQHVFTPNHIAPKDLLAVLPDRLALFARIVENRNQVLIEAPANLAEEILQQLQKADTPPPQVMLEAIICVVSPDSGFRFGLDWAHAVELNGKTAVDLGLSGLTFSGGASPIGLKNFYSDFAFTSAFIQLLAQEGYLSIRASPRVMAIDGQQAQISIVRQTFFSTQPLSSDLIFRQDIREVESGIDLEIIPTVRGDNVHVQIEKAEVSEDIRTQTTDRNLITNPFPIINRRRVTTNVTVEDGKTIVIGGLVSRQTVDRVSRIPGLVSIPGIGGLFERVEKQDQESEVVIFISPKIIRSEEQFTNNYCPPQTNTHSNEFISP